MKKSCIYKFSDLFWFKLKLEFEKSCIYRKKCIYSNISGCWRKRCRIYSHIPDGIAHIRLDMAEICLQTP